MRMHKNVPAPKPACNQGPVFLRRAWGKPLRACSGAEWNDRSPRAEGMQRVRSQHLKMPPVDLVDDKNDNFAPDWCTGFESTFSMPSSRDKIALMPRGSRAQDPCRLGKIEARPQFSVFSVSLSSATIVCKVFPPLCSF